MNAVLNLYFAADLKWDHLNPRRDKRHDYWLQSRQTSPADLNTGQPNYERYKPLTSAQLAA